MNGGGILVFIAEVEKVRGERKERERGRGRERNQSGLDPHSF